MKLALASDASGFKLKEAIKEFLQQNGHIVQDVGQQRPEEPVPYYIAASNLARLVQAGSCERGIAVCGTGAGVSMVANKFRGVYCVPCESIFTAERITQVNNANVLAMGQRSVSVDVALEMTGLWLATEFGKGVDPARQQANQAGYNFTQSLEGENFK